MRAGYVVRAARESDLPAIAEVVNAANQANEPTADVRTADQFLSVWAEMGRNRSAWVVAGPSDGIHGYGQVVIAFQEPDLVLADACTHPDHMGLGIGTALLAQIEARAAVMPLDFTHGGADVVVKYDVPLGGDAERLLRARGYRLTRIHERMEISLDGPVGAPVWPDQVSLRSCTGSEEDLRLVHECVEETQETLGDDSGWAPRSYDEWPTAVIHEGFDPALCLIAERAGRVVGVSLLRLRHVDDRIAGEVSRLSVRREARHLGIGQALLRAGFALLAERGAVSVGLDTPGRRPTDAHCLYERSGMTTTAAIGQFERSLRRNVDPLDRGSTAPQSG